MYIYTPQELKQFHEERIGRFQKMHTIWDHQKMNQTPSKWSLKKLFKRNGA